MHEKYVAKTITLHTKNNGKKITLVINSKYILSRYDSIHITVNKVNKLNVIPFKT